jgi:hypothetical protein
MTRLLSFCPYNKQPSRTETMICLFHCYHHHTNIRQYDSNCTILPIIFRRNAITVRPSCSIPYAAVNESRPPNLNIYFNCKFMLGESYHKSWSGVERSRV